MGTPDSRRSAPAATDSLEGRTLGSFILGPRLGSGGMGEVYRARDTRLGREVAVKLLPPHAALSPEARQRFDREARAISQLNHPHICVLFDVGHADGLDYLVMELLDGETLAARLSKGPLTLDELRRYALQVTQALAAAHERGIVHRDLKPGNIMLTAAGVKLLDFGLAKAAETSGLAPASEANTNTALTVAGMLVGTAPYMAPEVLKGRPADARADVFALGAVLFEMATNQAAFTGETVAAVAASILSHQPPSVSSVRPEVGPVFDRLVRECLVKDPTARWQSAHDAALQLAAPDLVASPAPAAPRQMRHWLGWATAVAIALIAVARPWFGTATGPTSAPTMAVQITPEGRQFLTSVTVVTFAVSPDGRELAFSSAGDDGVVRGWRRRLDAVEAQPIPGTEGGGTFAWSPDGKALAFFAGVALKRVDLATGSTVPVATVPRRSGIGGTWGADGQILFAAVDGQAIYRTNIGGGTPEAIITPDLAKGEARTQFPYFLPDGRSFLYLLRLQDGTSWLMRAAPGVAPVRVAPVDTQFAYLASGYLVYGRGGTLLADRFDLDAGTLSGNPVSIAPQVIVTPATAVAQFAASHSGTIVYQAQRNRSVLTWIDRTGREAGRLGTAGEYQYLRLSADGRRAIVSRIRATGVPGLWSVDTNLGLDTPLSTDETVTESNPIEVPGAGDIVFVSPRLIGQRVYRRHVATGTTEPATSSTTFHYALDVSPDGRRLAYYEQNESAGRTLLTTALDDPKSVEPIRNAPPGANSVRYSPDGRHYLFSAFDAEGVTLFVGPVGDGASVAVQQLRQKDGLARWSRDGRSIICMTSDGEVLSIPIRTSPSLEVGAATTLFRLGRAWIDFDTAPDGRILAAVPELVADEAPLTAVLNWRPPAR